MIVTLSQTLRLDSTSRVLSGRVVRLREAIHDLTTTRDLVPDEAPKYLSDYVAGALTRALQAPGVGSDVQRQLALCNEVLDLIGRLVPGAVLQADDAIDRAALLLAVLDQPQGLLPVRSLRRPETPLAQDSLFVHAPHEPNLAAELAAELESADGVDLICAFIVWPGIRIFLDVIKQLRLRLVPVRVLTTTYTGITEPRALEELRDLGVQIKVSYDTGVTRLHAKAWLIRRRTRFSTAYIGSSNVTHTALHEGLEWNVRLSEASSPELIDRFEAAFETYWDDPQFEDYDAERFAAAVKAERSPGPSTPILFDIRPYPFQEEILERLDGERRRHNRWRNLLVAATGTGKTVVSAFDYRRLVDEKGSLRLLFVAHRREILEQSLGTFRAVLHDGAFGALYMGGGRVADADHVFASIQALSRLDLERDLPPSYFDVVIIDEFHHARAKTYDDLLKHLRPGILLGMTATPERADGKDVTEWFEGRIAAELRLWDALQQGLLCPFQYFGIADDVDLSRVTWRRGGYDLDELSELYTADDMRMLKVIRGVERYVADPRRMRALGFAVSIEHARYMAQRFNDAGIPAAHLSGDSPTDMRREVLRKLRQREINAIFSVDIFNEGLDIPEVDTVLLLRPTESATVFLQQLGRGLRRTIGKSGLTVLDFIGQQHRQFRFEPRFAAVTRTGGRKLLEEIEAGFPSLPAGCSMQLDRVVSETVVENIKVALTSLRRAQLAAELRAMGDISLAEFLHRSARSPEDVYRSGRGWTELRRMAGFVGPAGPDEAVLAGAIARMLHVDDPERAALYSGLLQSELPPRSSQLTQREQRLLTMLHFDLWGRQRKFADLDEAFARFWPYDALRDELAQLLAILEDRSTSLPIDPGLGPNVPLWAHQRYTRDEVFAALGDATPAKPPTSREGVRYIRPERTDIFYVTLQKMEGKFSPTTMYKDYAISPTLFHWESQSTTSESSPTGQRYINHLGLNSSVCLFARESPATVPFVFLGKGTYVQHERERPMRITWRLDHAVPGDFYLIARAAA